MRLCILAGLCAAIVLSAGERITVDYPAEQSIFPPDITAPTFLWRDTSPATTWRIDVTFSDRSPALHFESAGERLRIGEIDPEAVADSNKPPALTPELAAAHTWIPDAATWTTIKQHSIESAAITVTGIAADGQSTVSTGEVHFRTSRDPVAAPIFYRDVPLMPNQSDKGVIKPLPANAVGLIKWRLRYINEPESHVVMERIATCANCHSFSLDGKTLGLDVDGPQNARGLYALLPIQKQMAIRNQDLIQWPVVRDPKVKLLRASFMSQVSPDGRFVLTTIDDPEAANRDSGRSLEDKYYNANFLDYRFLQVFYPTRGILAWYDRDAKHLQPLPGASDPRFVQTDGVWSPDGMWIVFARAEAKSPYAEGGKLAEYANDPNETQIKYELYRMPFNNGKGGVPERIEGASANGMSNNFPKVSPDGRWIVFVQCRNGQLMRPDSRLFIVPFEGGKARMMKCNTSLMNSWHTFSPNGRWMAFSSKSRSPYTQMYLTHISENGDDSPPILVDNSTAANRAVNIPEFVNIAAGGLEKIAAPATEFYRYFNTAIEDMKANRFDEAVVRWRKALAINDADALAHFNLAYSLSERGQLAEAITEYRRSIECDGTDPVVYANLGLALAHDGKLDDAISAYSKSLELNAGNPAVQADLGVALAESGKPADGIAHLKKALDIDPNFADAHNKLGSILGKTGDTAAALTHLEDAVRLNPASVEYRFNLAYVLGMKGSFVEAIPHLEKAVELSQGKDWQCLALLGTANFKAGRAVEAVRAVQRALDVAVQDGNSDVTARLRSTLESYQAMK